MSTFILVLQIIALIVCSAVALTRVPCLGDGCTNITVYLGPRWGSKIISVPKIKNMTTTAKGDANNIAGKLTRDPPGSILNRGDARYPVPQHRPVPPNNQVQIDFSDNPKFDGSGMPVDFDAWSRYRTTRRPVNSKVNLTNSVNLEVRVIVDIFGRGTVNISNRGYSGYDFKAALSSLLEEDRKQVTTLIAENNRVNDLLYLVFPVEFEYNLQELSLSGNSFTPPVISLSSSFELSRLGRLKTLNLSRCNIEYFGNRLNLPSLEVLDLSKNRLSYLPSGIMGLASLQHLYLQDNSIKYMSATFLSPLKSIWVIDLSGNGLEEFLDDPFNELHSLITLRLANNSLVYPPDLHSSRTKLVSLSDNPLWCSCPLVNILHNPNIEVVDKHLVICYDNESDGGNMLVQKQALYLDEADVNIGCPLVPPRLEEFKVFVSTYYYNHSYVIHKFFNMMILSVIAFVLAGAVLVCWRRRRSMLEKLKPSEVPYTILDDRQANLFIVSQNGKNELFKHDA